jgi:hypothetical protein
LGSGADAAVVCTHAYAALCATVVTADPWATAALQGER